MKIVIRLLTLFVIAGCDTAPKWPNGERCMTHRWKKGVYKFKSVKEASVNMTNLESGQKYETSIFEHGWSEVKCP